jgi:hypothetical protein
LQQLTKQRGLAKYPEIVQESAYCRLEKVRGFSGNPYFHSGLVDHEMVGGATEPAWKSGVLKEGLYN